MSLEAGCDRRTDEGVIGGAIMFVGRSEEVTIT